MRTYVCTSCHGSITVGHPSRVFRRQARALARVTASWAQRVLRRGSRLKKYLAAIEDRYYLEPGRFRSLPSACPHCGHRGAEDLPWWQPGVAFPG